MKNLSYKKIGKGMPFVLVHGYLGGQNMWKFQEELKYDYELIMPSLAGYGESSHLTAPSTIRENAEQVFELLNHLNIDTFYLLGHSMGGMIVTDKDITKADKPKPEKPLISPAKKQIRINSNKSVLFNANMSAIIEGD